MDKKLLIWSLTLFLSIGDLLAQSNCLGDEKELLIRSNMPYMKISVDGYEGYYLIDYGATVSTIDSSVFINGTPNSSTAPNKFDNFDFYGSWGTVTLIPSDHSNIQGLGDIKQAGIIGTDFLSLNAFLLDYENEKIYRNNGDICTSDWLINNGFKEVSSSGYFSNTHTKLNNSCTFNVPTVPIRIGKAIAVAQIDPGFDDNRYKHSLNINRAFYNSLIATGIELEEVSDANFSLSTCVEGVTESVTVYRVKSDEDFEIVGVDGNPVLVTSDYYLFLKNPPQNVKSCGGIGTWQIPAAQFGASFLNDSKQILFDPFNSRVWFKKNPANE